MDFVDKKLVIWAVGTTVAAALGFTFGSIALAEKADAQTTVVNQQASQFGVVHNSVSSQVYNIAVQQFNAGNQRAIASATAFAHAGPRLPDV